MVSTIHSIWMVSRETGNLGTGINLGGYRVTRTFVDLE